jgi:1-acyl-sn-glycerol-3-phosphate acyltransferase
MVKSAGKLEIRFLRKLVEAIILRDLRTSFRRVTLIGGIPEFETGLPVVLYANHHSYYDGYVGWLVASSVLKRSIRTWVREWDTFPLFAPLGALPFPAEDPIRRAISMRQTQRHLTKDPQSVFLYFPEGNLHPASEGILPFDTEHMRRLSGLLPKAIWSPMAIHVESWCDARPVLLVAIGAGHLELDGNEVHRLEQLWNRLRATPPLSGTDILIGKPGANERWSMKPLANYFRRFI